MKILRKKDELQFPRLFANIRYRENQGLLIFLDCTSSDVESFLIKRIKDEFHGQYRILTIPVQSSDYSPLNRVDFLQPNEKALYIFNQFPFEDYFQSPENYTDAIDKLLSSLNMNRDIIPEKRLKCIFICPAEIEDQIALKAADFYHFKTFSASFTDDAGFHRKIADFEKGGQEEKDRIEFLEARLKEAEKEEDMGSIHFQLGETCYRISDNEKALYHWQNAKIFYEKLKDQRNLASALGSIGLVYQVMGDIESALKYHCQALEIHKKVGYLQGEASSLGSIGLVYQVMGDIESALKYHSQALEIHKKVGYLQGEASSLGNIGLVYQDMGDMESALKYHSQALEIHKKVGYLQGEASSLGNIGLVYQDMGDMESALKYHSQALDIHKRIGYLQGEASNLGNIGLVYQDMGDMESALKYQSQALDIHKRIGYLQGEASSLGNIGLVYQGMGDMESALKYYSQAKAIFEEIGMANQAERLGELIKEAISPVNPTDQGAYENGSKIS